MLRRWKRLVVFAGASVPKAARSPITTYRPPIRRGDLGRLMTEIGPEEAAILIVDGTFGDSLALTLSECRLCLEAGYSLFGCSSIGALRAADAWSLGMIGMGYVYSLLRTGKVIDDSEVAVRYDDDMETELTFSGVRIRYVLGQLVRERALGVTAARCLLRQCLQVPWYERIEGRVAELFESAGLATSFNCLRQVEQNPKVIDARQATAFLNREPW